MQASVWLSCVHWRLFGSPGYLRRHRSSQLQHLLDGLPLMVVVVVVATTCAAVVVVPLVVPTAPPLHHQLQSAPQAH